MEQIKKKKKKKKIFEYLTKIFEFQTLLFEFSLGLACVLLVKTNVSLFSRTMLLEHPSFSFSILLPKVLFEFQTLIFEASVAIVADFSPKFNPLFRWCNKHQTQNDSSYQ